MSGQEGFQTLCEFDRIAAYGRVAGGRNSAGKFIRLGPRIEQGPPIPHPKFSRTDLLQKVLPNQMGDNSGNQPGTGPRALDQIALFPCPVRLRQQTADDPHAFPNEDIARFSLKTKVPARQCLSINQESLGPEISPTVQVDDAHVAFAALLQKRSGELRHHQERKGIRQTPG